MDFFPRIIPEFTVFKFIARMVIRAVGIWGYYFLFVGLDLFICTKFIYKALKEEKFETAVAISILMLILVGGIIALVNT